MIQIEAFSAVLEAIAAVLPFGKPLSETAYAISWAAFPEQARQELTDADLAWAAGQYLQDPKRDEYPEPVAIALLRYLYRVGDGRPRLDWGPRWPNGRPQTAAFMGSRTGEAPDEAALLSAQDQPLFPEPPPCPQLAGMVQALAAEGTSRGPA